MNDSYIARNWMYRLESHLQYFIHFESRDRTYPTIYQAYPILAHYKLYGMLDTNTPITKIVELLKALDENKWLSILNPYHSYVSYGLHTIKYVLKYTLNKWRNRLDFYYEITVDQEEAYKFYQKTLHIVTQTHKKNMIWLGTITPAMTHDQHEKILNPRTIHPIFVELRKKYHLPVHKNYNSYY